MKWYADKIRPEESGEYFVYYGYGYAVVHYSKKHDAWNAYDHDKDTKNRFEDVIAWAHIPSGDEIRKNMITERGTEND